MRYYAYDPKSEKVKEDYKNLPDCLRYFAMSSPIFWSEKEDKARAEARYEMERWEAGVDSLPEHDDLGYLTQ